ncbi:MAG: hypothetical protein Q8N23_10010 [Archangium sp.]|nr:hypothetical protein [Archangium sp.]MDP3572619.1 hypothetical protein [Archangium sp.]
MSRFSRPLLISVLLLSGCDASIKVDPEGYRCDVGNVCPSGFTCREGVCRAALDTSCTGVVCTTPPASSCVNGTTLRNFSGSCVAGQCQYAPVDSTCATTCAQDACVDACDGVDCVTPPQAACTDANTLRTFSQTGACAAGACSYVTTDTTCPNGCEAGLCKGVDLCQSMSVVCTTPPSATCVADARRTFSTPGTCEPGTGMCTYASNDSACPNGCALGQCLTASLAFAQTGPRLHFAVNGLDIAPGSSGNSALAVGNGGKIARWDGSMWTELAAPGNDDLNKVAFVSGTVAYAVGAGRTVLTVRPSMNQVTDVPLSGSGGANLVAVSGRDVGEVLIASETGDWWRMRAGTWTTGALPPATAPYRISGAYLDESLRERIVGACGMTVRQCVAYRYASGGTPNFIVHTQAGTPGFTAVGGAFDVASDATPLAVVGSADLSLDTHSNFGNFVAIAPSPALEGAGIVGITAQAVNLGRDLFVLTSSRDPDPNTSGKGGLYRLARGVGVSSTEILETYFGEETLSPNEANGVLVAEVRRAQNINNVFRRGVITNEALDVGEDFIGASVDDTGALVLASRFGDVVVRRPTQSTFDFRRPPSTWAIKALEARNGTGVLLVGGASGNLGVIIRVTPAGFTTVTSRSGTSFNAVCRVSDTEGWAVGTGGVIYRVTGTAGTQVASPTTKDLLTLDCAAGVAVAAGADGTVIRLANGTWSAVTPAFPVTGRPLTSARLAPGGAFVAGDNLFYGFTASTGVWTQLTAKAGLSSLVVRGPQEVYGAFITGTTSEVLRFDGAAWGPRLLQVSGALGGGVQAGPRVVWGGSLGAIVEAR